jgi:hypothetical protein
MTASGPAVIDRIVVPLPLLPTAFGRVGIVSGLSPRGQGREAVRGLTVASPLNFDYSLATWAGRLFSSQGPFIFNLGHGVLPKTRVGHVERLVERVRRAPASS